MFLRKTNSEFSKIKGKKIKQKSFHARRDWLKKFREISNSFLEKTYGEQQLKISITS